MSWINELYTSQVVAVGKTLWMTSLTLHPFTSFLLICLLLKRETSPKFILGCYVVDFLSCNMMGSSSSCSVTTSKLILTTLLLPPCFLFFDFKQCDAFLCFLLFILNMPYLLRWVCFISSFKHLIPLYLPFLLSLILSPSISSQNRPPLLPGPGVLSPVSPPPSLQRL